MESVGVVIVSHSPKVAEGAADMVRQMVGEEVPLAWTGGNPSGGLGTDVGQIMAAIDRAWSNAGVVVLVDLGGAETNSEMAIEMLPADRQGKVLICNAPVVEGAVVAATEAAGGSSVETVRQTAEEYSAR
jgi:dihydroxyacetone kinase phosphotransfer subunit